MKTIYIHLTDPPYKAAPNEIIDGVRFEGTGSTCGRFIFTRTIFLDIPAKAKVTIKNCEFRYANTGIRV